jgi:threonine dehydrogenase-like Zn-dependent dehydrogenase
MSDRLAAAAIAALAPSDEPVEVLGESALARAVRSRLGARVGGDTRPAAVVDTTGDPRVIQHAMERVADLGTVVLAGPPPGEAVALDLYADLHVRGLTVIGIEPGGEEHA